MIRIIDENIERVPMIQSETLSEEFWDKLHKEHQNLLRLAQDKELGTECARVFNLGMEKQGRDYIGSPGENRVLVENFDIPHIIIHNHADGATISLEDFDSFLRRPNTFSIQAVSNGGPVHLLEKLPHYNAVDAIRKYINALEEISILLDAEKTQDEVEGVVEEFLKSLTEDGFAYGRWV